MTFEASFLRDQVVELLHFSIVAIEEREEGVLSACGALDATEPHFSSAESHQLIKQELYCLARDYL